MDFPNVESYGNIRVLEVLKVVRVANTKEVLVLHPHFRSAE